MLVFVVDASRPQLFPVAKQHLHELLASDPCLPLMVLANKQVSVTGKHSSTNLLVSGFISSCATQTHLFLSDLMILSILPEPDYKLI